MSRENTYLLHDDAAIISRALSYYGFPDALLFVNDTTTRSSRHATAASPIRGGGAASCLLGAGERAPKCFMLCLLGIPFN